MTNKLLVFIMVAIAIYEIKVSKDRTGRLTVKEIIISSAFFLAGVMAFFWFTGVITSGFHLTDDAAIYSIGRRVSDNGLGTTLSEILISDLNSRYRPVYYVVYTIECVVFGTNFVIWHVLYAIMTAANMSMAYCCARLRGCPRFSGMVFAVSIFKGSEQGEVMWRLGVQENICVFFVLLSLILLRQYYEKRTRKYLILSIVSTFIVSLTKESCLLLLPACPFILLFWELLDSESFYFYDLWDRFKKHMVYILGTAAIFALGAIVILTHVGTGVARAGSQTGITGMLKGILSVYKGGIGIYVKIAAVAFILVAAELFVIGDKKQTSKKKAYILMLVIFAGSLGLQFYLHAGLGMIGHYLIPSTIIVALCVYVAVPVLYDGASNGSRTYYWLFLLISGYMLFMNMQDQYYAEEFAQNGRDITSCLDRIGGNGDGNTTVLADLDYEEDYAASVFLQEKHKIYNTYNVCYTGSSDGRFYDGYHPETDEDRSITIADADYVIVYSGSEEDIVKQSGAESDYTAEDYGSFCLYVNRKIAN